MLVFIFIDSMAVGNNGQEWWHGLFVCIVVPCLQSFSFLRACGNPWSYAAPIAGKPWSCAVHGVAPASLRHVLRAALCPFQEIRMPVDIESLELGPIPILITPKRFAPIRAESPT